MRSVCSMAALYVCWTSTMPCRTLVRVSIQSRVLRVCSTCLIVPLRLAPVNNTLVHNIAHYRRLECIKLNFSFYSAAAGEIAVLREQLSRFRLPQVLESLMFRSMLRVMTGLAKELPLVFHEPHAQVGCVHAVRGYELMKPGRPCSMRASICHRYRKVCIGCLSDLVCIETFITSLRYAAHISLKAGC